MNSRCAPATLPSRLVCEEAADTVPVKSAGALCAPDPNQISPLNPCEGSSGFIDSLQCSVGYIEVSFWLWNPMLVEYASRFGPRAIPKRTDLFFVLMLTRPVLEGSNPDRFVMIQI